MRDRHDALVADFTDVVFDGLVTVVSVGADMFIESVVSLGGDQ